MVWINLLFEHFFILTHFWLGILVEGHTANIFKFITAIGCSAFQICKEILKVSHWFLGQDKVRPHHRYVMMMRWHLYRALSILMFQCALQHFVGDFGQTALCSLQFFEREFCCSPQFWKYCQTIRQGATFLTLCEKCLGSLMSPAHWHREDAGDRAWGLLSLSKMTRMSNHFQIS